MFNPFLFGQTYDEDRNKKLARLTPANFQTGIAGQADSFGNQQAARDQQTAAANAKAQQEAEQLKSKLQQEADRQTQLQQQERADQLSASQQQLEQQRFQQQQQIQQQQFAADLAFRRQQAAAQQAQFNMQQQGGFGGGSGGQRDGRLPNNTNAWGQNFLTPYYQSTTPGMSGQWSELFQPGGSNAFRAAFGQQPYQRLQPQQQPQQQYYEPQQS